MIRYYDKQGKPIYDTLEWAKLFEDVNYKKVDLTEVNGYRISTVWLGLDHSLHSNVPLIFETMVFGKDADDDMERYSTLEEAQAGHLRFVEKYAEKD